ncbi:hypothetical protein BDQ12DRAFT_680032 [Crucibulum laeve]|uniref:SET domain-containing protein n=1 Tax=Crucibulum laeve TaxID=68775 RepID=A0A5C3M5V8_9AGAR|nr:hypothetical protein BDQ12DRAFT_680032 [Crucibulum laeve]
MPEPLCYEDIKLIAHVIARDQAVATRKLLTGSNILSVPGLATVLLPSEKGRRCDTCHRLQTDERVLRRCTGCASYWYCDAKCQNTQWRSHHKRICKIYNQFISSPQFQALQAHEKMDSLLLSHMVAQMSATTFPLPTEDDSSQLSTFVSLLPGPIENVVPPPICPISPMPSKELLSALYSRFGNNNFVVHSHLTTFGHGVFPLASRLFNHSCVPNAAAKYTLSPAKTVNMEVIALRDILPDEEICLPYLDPALLQSRHQMFELTYGFKCNCSSCIFLRNLGRMPEPPKDPLEISTLSKQLREYVGIEEHIGLILPSPSMEAISHSLLPVLHESYMGELSETFSRSSHEGQYAIALDVGITLLALYILIYPSNYPQIGMHLLELAKTRWNEAISSDVRGDEETVMKEQVRVFLTFARRVLMVLGPEGDEYGPLQEIQTLEDLLNQ